MSHVSRQRCETTTSLVPTPALMQDKPTGETKVGKPHRFCFGPWPGVCGTLGTTVKPWIGFNKVPTGSQVRSTVLTVELGHFEFSFGVFLPVETDFKQSNDRLIFNQRDELPYEDKLNLTTPILHDNCVMPIAKLMGRVIIHSKSMSKIGKPSHIELATISYEFHKLHQQKPWNITKNMTGNYA